MSIARFSPRKAPVEYSVEAFLANGGEITVCKQGRRNRANTSFPVIKGSIATVGRKQVSLRNSGVTKGLRG